MLLCTITLVVGAVVVYLNSHYLYILGERVGVNCEKVEMNVVTPEDLTQFTLDELMASEKVQFEQSTMLINAEYLLTDDYVPCLAQYKDTGLQMNECLHNAFEKLSLAVNTETGSKLFVSSAYRTKDEQRELYEEDSSTANIPGSSEHEAGLALDVYVQYNAGFGFIKTEAGQFVNSHCWEYGFIIRYPSYGKKETGMKYEPWHIRYVGEPHAKIIYNNHLTLEEYILSLEDGVWYEIDDYLISRQKLSDNNTLEIPEICSDIVISPDNTGSYIVTLTRE